MIKLAYSNLSQRCDLSRGSGNLHTDEGLETAVLISLFTDRLADASADLPKGADRRGWWGSAFGKTKTSWAGLGSHLWLLARSKLTAAAPATASRYCKEALQWLIDDGVAKDISVTTTVLRRGVGLSAINITRQDGKLWTRKWEVSLGI